MKSGNAVASLALFLFLVILTACGGNEANSNSKGSTGSDGNGENAPVAKTNVEELGMLVNVPYESEDVVWMDFPKQKKIVAVLRFSQAEASRLTVDAEKIRPAQPTTITSEKWFPPELIAQGNLTGDDTLKGRSYAANAFFQDQYNDGRITRIEDTDYFILELSAK